MRGPDRPEKLEKITSSGEEGAAQRVLLLVLLLVVVLFGYLYFFTGVIKPREEVIPPAAVPSVAKKPIPPRPGAEQPTQAETPKPPAAVPSVPADKAGAPKDSGKVSPAEPKTAPPAAPQKKEQPQVAKKASPVSSPAATAAPKADIPVSAAKKKVPAAAPDTGKGKKTGGTDAISKPKAPAKKIAAQYALSIGDFIVERDLKKAERQLKKLGIKTLNVTCNTKEEPMHRLHVGDYASRDSAEMELKKVQKLSGSAFLLPVKGKYAVYAGSYFNEKQAVKEKERINTLLGSGSSVTVEKAKVNVPVKRLIAGAFADKEAAVAEAGRLKKAGMKSTVVPLRKAAK